MIEGKPVKDFDIFFPSESDYNKILQDLQNKNCVIKSNKASNGRTVSNIFTEIGQIQLVSGIYYPTLESLLESFDFTIVAAGIKFNGDHDLITEISDPYGKCSTFCFHERFFVDIAQKKIVLQSQNIPYPLNTLQRLIKYTKYGYDNCPKALARLLVLINEMTIDWKNPDQNIIEFYPDGTPKFLGVD